MPSVKLLVLVNLSVTSARIGINSSDLTSKRQAQAPTGQSVYQDPDWNDQNGAHCYLTPTCTDHNNPGPGVCGPEEMVVGWDYANCGGQKGKPVCCPSTTNVDNW